MLCSHELWTARRLNFLTFNVVPCKQNTWRHKFSAGRKFIRCHVKDAIDTKRIWQKSSEKSAQFLLLPLKGVYEGHGNDNVKDNNNNSNNKNNKLGTARIFNTSKIRAFRFSFHTESRSPYENFNAKIEAEFLSGTVANLTGAMWTPPPRKFL